MSNRGIFFHYPRLFISRAAVGIVLFINIQCAIVFLLSPAQYAGSFELTGVSGNAAIRGMAVLFCMWNIPYVFALLDPVKNMTSYLQACLMQATGLLGESMIAFTLPENHSLLFEGLRRFLLFDAIGLVILCLGYLVIRKRHV